MAAVDRPRHLRNLNNAQPSLSMCLPVKIDRPRNLLGQQCPKIGKPVALHDTGIIEADDVRRKVGAVGVVRAIGMAVWPRVQGGDQALILLGRGGEAVAPQPPRVGHADRLPPLAVGLGVLRPVGEDVAQHPPPILLPQAIDQLRRGVFQRVFGAIRCVEEFENRRGQPVIRADLVVAREGDARRLARLAHPDFQRPIRTHAVEKDRCMPHRDVRAEAAERLAHQHSDRPLRRTNQDHTKQQHETKRSPNRSGSERTLVHPSPPLPQSQHLPCTILL
jgi:hypothetical protein